MDLCAKGQLNVTLTKYGFVCFLICLGFSGMANAPDEHNGGIGVTGLIKPKSSFIVLSITGLHKAISSFIGLGVTGLHKTMSSFIGLSVTDLHKAMI